MARSILGLPTSDRSRCLACTGGEEGSLQSDDRGIKTQPKYPNKVALKKRTNLYMMPASRHNYK